MHMSFLVLRSRRYLVENGDLSSYRPISNLPFLPKLLERVVSVQLTDYLSSAGLLPVHQSAYRKFHSTETALLKVSPTSLRRLMLEIMRCSACLIYRQRLIPST